MISNKMLKILGVLFVLVGAWSIFFGQAETNMYRLYHEPVFKMHPIAGGLVAVVYGGLVLIAGKVKI